MANYNILATMSVDFSLNIDVPAEVVKSGNIKDWVSENLIEIVEQGGIECLSKQFNNYSKNSISIDTEDYTKLKSDTDELENDLMEFDIFD